MRYAFGSKIHESCGNHICGTYMASITPAGELLKCDYYEDWSGGNVKQGLFNAWKNLPRIFLSDLECDCKYLDTCRGGCRYRAELYNNFNRLAPDPVACQIHNVGTKPTKNPERGEVNENQKGNS